MIYLTGATANGASWARHFDNLFHVSRVAKPLVLWHNSLIVVYRYSDSIVLDFKGIFLFKTQSEFLDNSPPKLEVTFI